MASQRVKREIAEAKAQHGGARPGAGKPKGVRLTMATREKIKGAALINRLHKIAMGEAPQAEPHHVTAGLGLLRFQLPQLQATDITSGGEQLKVEIVMYGERKGRTFDHEP